jgi:hypothetical protein
MLPDYVAIDIVGYSLNIAAILQRRPLTQLMLLGGLYHTSSATFFSRDSGPRNCLPAAANCAPIPAGPVRGRHLFADWRRARHTGLAVPHSRGVSSESACSTPLEPTTRAAVAAARRAASMGSSPINRQAA